MSSNKKRGLLLIILTVSLLSMALSFSYLFTSKIFHHIFLIVCIISTAVSSVIATLLFYHKKVELLYRNSLVDPVTKLYNYKEFNKRLRQEKARTQRSKIPFSLLIIDIDNFKALNSKFGYKNADLLMLQLIDVIQLELRKTDTLFRYRNGDEFAIIAINTNKNGAHSFSKRLSKTVENSSFTLNKKEIRLTISIGASSYLDKESNIEDYACIALNKEKKQSKI